MTDGWHKTTLTRLYDLLAADPVVRGLLVYGSAVDTPDLWSDLDVCIVLADGGLPQYFPTLDWLQQFADTEFVDAQIHLYFGLELLAVW